MGCSCVCGQQLEGFGRVTMASTTSAFGRATMSSARDRSTMPGNATTPPTPTSGLRRMPARAALRSSPQAAPQGSRASRSRRLARVPPSRAQGATRPLHRTVQVRERQPRVQLGSAQMDVAPQPHGSERRTGEGSPRTSAPLPARAQRSNDAALLIAAQVGDDGGVVSSGVREGLERQVRGARLASCRGREPPTWSRSLPGLRGQPISVVLGRRTQHAWPRCRSALRPQRNVTSGRATVSRNG